MANAMDELTKKFEGFESQMTLILDKLSGLESWRSTTEAGMDEMLT